MIQNNTAKCTHRYLIFMFQKIKKGSDSKFLSERRNGKNMFVHLNQNYFKKSFTKNLFIRFLLTVMHKILKIISFGYIIKQ